jgi:hypothetical protein
VEKDFFGGVITVFLGVFMRYGRKARFKQASAGAQAY